MLPDEPSNPGLRIPMQESQLDPEFSAGTAGSILHPLEALSADMPIGGFLERLRTDLKELRVFPVVRGTQPVGIVDKLLFLERMSSPYARDLHCRGTLADFVPPGTLRFEVGTPLERVVQVVTCNGDLLHLPPERNSFLIVEDDCYKGVGFVMELLARITELQMRQARHANPLTGLPGNGPIQKRLEALLGSGKPFRLGYCDLDNFKAFNDRYGYARGDSMILEVGRILREIFDPSSPFGRDSFVGHVGGDDFVVLVPWDVPPGTWQAILDSFAGVVPNLYDPVDFQAGGILGKDRAGEEAFHPLASLSIGVVPCPPGAFHHVREVAQRAAEVKTLAKRTPGNSWFEDRRGLPS